MNNKRSLIIYCSLVLVLALPNFLFAENTTVDGHTLTPRVSISLSPKTGTFTEGSTFTVPVLINTNGSSIKSIKIKVNFDKDKLAIIRPSSGVSVVGVWTQSPSYDNLLGLAEFVGTIPNGLITESGLIVDITFKAIGSGQAKITISDDSKVILDDKQDTPAILDFSRAEYTILRKLSEGVNIFSETNSSEAKWYVNNSPIFSWDRDAGVTGFSFILDDKPNTIPDNTIDSNETTKSYESLADGLWYFHVKAYKNSGWSTTGHFLVKIDTVPPADFKLESSHLLAATALTGRTLVYFFTTDNLSGVDHYEVGTIDQNQPISQSPVFIETASPFQAPLFKGTSLKVIVRAVDKAGNIRDSSIDIKPPFIIWDFLKNNIEYVLLVIILFVLYYLNKYHIINPFRHLNSLNIIETDIKSFVEKQKEINQENITQQEKIKELKEELTEVEGVVHKEINDTKPFHKENHQFKKHE